MGSMSGHQGSAWSLTDPDLHKSVKRSFIGEKTWILLYDKDMAK